MFHEFKSAANILVALAVAAGAMAGEASDLQPVTMLDAPGHEPVILVEAGQGKAEIVANRKALGREGSRALLDLQKYIKLTTGAELSIVETQKDPATPAIIVATDSEAVARKLDPDPLPVEGFFVQTAPRRVFIVGHGGPGVAWGIYDFLERFVGLRWYWPEYRDKWGATGTSLVKTDTLTIPPVRLRDQPVFRKRHRYPSGGPRVGAAMMSDHDRHLRAFNSWPVSVIVHAPHDWATRYRDSRPEIFQKQGDGGRVWTMLCYGNARTLETYLEEIERQIASPKDIPRKERIVRGKTITVSPADMSLTCRCADCRQLWDETAGQYGAASQVMGAFVRKLAVEVKKRWPDMTIIFLPYKNYTYAPKGLRFPGNVEVQICGMPGLAQYKEAAINASEQANIDAWIKVSDRKIQNWHYSCWPADRTKAAYLFPYTIRRHYQDNRDKTVGTFINGIKDHWRRQHLSLYVWLKCLWNPDFPVEKAIDEFCRRMFGPAAGTMRELVQMQIDGWQRPWSSKTFSPRSVYMESFPRQDVLKVAALLDRALEEARGDALATERLAYYAGPMREFFDESKLIAEGGGGVRNLGVYQAAETPVIDGKLDEACWRDIEPVRFVRAMDRKQTTPRYPTALKAVWSRDGIIFGFRMDEPQIDQLKKDIGRESRDAAQIWWNDNVEIFLDVTGKREEYYQFIVNANGAVYDARGKDFEWNAMGLKTGAYIGKDFWSLEVFLPYATFKNFRKPGTGVEWFGNFTRHRVTLDRKQREYQRFNTLYSGPSNDQNAFGALKFIER